MTLSEIMPTIQSLPRADNLRLMEMLAAQIARDEEAARDVADKTVSGPWTLDSGLLCH